MSSNTPLYGDRDDRLVKLRLPADLVRAMDRAIVRSRGAYLDRNEFVAEAIRDRLNEEGVPPVEELAIADEVAVGSQHPVGESRPAAPEWGRWREGTVPTASAVTLDGVNFGLHNRDLPTLWALDQLADRASELGAPIKWKDFTAELRKQAQSVGAWLRERDKEGRRTLKAAIGFPKTGEKARASEDRFLTASVGSLTRGGPEGPMFLLRLAGLSQGDQRLAPTPEGLQVLRKLIEAGLGNLLPQPRAACSVWWRYVASAAPEEHQYWVRLLKVIEQQPNRAELVAEFPEWTGSLAETNCMGLVSRSREWDLVTNELVDGRYQLTEFGRRVLEEGGVQ
jgi:hypothetical protein